MCLAVPGQVLRIVERDGTTLGEVDFGGVRREVCLQYLPEVRVGEYVIVHVGFAIQRLDDESARKTLTLFEELDVLEQDVGDSPRRAAGPASAREGTAG